MSTRSSRNDRTDRRRGDPCDPGAPAFPPPEAENGRGRSPVAMTARGRAGRQSAAVAGGRSCSRRKRAAHATFVASDSTLGDGGANRVGLVALRVEQLDDAANDARPVGEQVLVIHDERRDGVDLEPSQPAEPLLLDILQASSDRTLVVSQGDRRGAVHRRPGVGLHRFRHGHRLGQLVPPIEVDIGRRRQQPDHRWAPFQRRVEVMEMRLHSKHAVAGGAASEQLCEVILRRSGLQAFRHHLPQHPALADIEIFGRRAKQAGAPKLRAKERAAAAIRGGRPHRTCAAEPIAGNRAGRPSNCERAPECRRRARRRGPDCRTMRSSRRRLSLCWFETGRLQPLRGEAIRQL